ncbi:hypothetical protein ACA910_020091 [Epithemia clementina (nom. ined.)]
MNRFAHRALNILCLLIFGAFAAAAESGLRSGEVGAGAADSHDFKSKRNLIVGDTGNLPNYNNCHEINRRPIYGTGDLPKTVARDDGRILLAKHHQPFHVPVYGSDHVRKWRLYAIYSDQKKTSSSPSVYANLQIEFDFLGSVIDPVVTMETTGVNNIDFRAEGYSGLFEINPNSYNANVYVKFHTNDRSNLHGKVWYIELLAYDCYAN